MTQKVLTLIVKGKDEASSVLTGAGGSVSKLGKLAGIAAGVGVAALGAAAVGAAVGVSKLALDAAQLEGTRITFERLSESMGGATHVTDELRDATRGMVTDNDLWAASNKFVTMGLTETSTETAEMMEMATQLGMAMGEGPTASMENFALMMANQSIPRLDSFGISSATVRERIAELQEQTEGLSREEAFNIAVMEQGRLAMEKVGEQGDNAGAAMARMKTNVQNLKDGIGRAFIPVLNTLLPYLEKAVDWLGPRLTTAAEMIAPWLAEKIPLAMDAISRFIDNPIRPALDWLKTQFDNFTTAILPHLTTAWDTLKGGFETISNIYNTALKPAIEKLTESLGLGKAKTDDVSGSFGGFIGKLLEISTKGLVTGLTAGIQLLTIGVSLATGAVEWFKDRMDAVHRAIDKVASIVRWLKDRINDLKNAFRNLTLPSWLTSHSPTPLETGLIGIKNAFADLPDFSTLPGLGGGGLTLGTAGGRAVVYVTNNFGPGSVRSDEDIMRISDQIQQSLRLRGMGVIL